MNEIKTEEGKEVKEKVKKKPKKPPKSMPWFMPFVCDGCGDCVKACPQGGIELQGLDKKIPKAWLVAPEYCIGCAKCAEACQSSAVQMTAYVEQAIARYKNPEKRPYHQ
jgi:ferredoxin